MSSVHLLQSTQSTVQCFLHGFQSLQYFVSSSVWIQNSKLMSQNGEFEIAYFFEMEGWNYLIYICIQALSYDTHGCACYTASCFW